MVKNSTVASLAKSIYYVHFSIEYMEDVKRELSGEPKAFMQNLINRQRIVIKSMYDRMPEHTASVLRKELNDTDVASMDSIMNLLVALDEGQRLKMESYIEELIKEKEHAN